MNKISTSSSLISSESKEIICKIHISKEIPLMEEYKRKSLVTFDSINLTTVADFQEWLVGALNLRTIGNIMATKHIYLMIDGYYLVPSQSSRCILSGAIIELHICDDDGKTTSSELPSIINITSNLTKQSLEKMQSQSNKRKRNEKNKNKNLNLMSVSFALSQFESPVSTTYADQSTSIEINSTETPSKINEYEQSLPTPMTDTEQSPIAITSTPTARSKRRNRNKNKLNSSAISDQPNKVNPLGTPILRSSSGTNQRDISKASGFLPSVPLSTNKSSDKTHFRFVSSATDSLNKFSSSAGNGADNVDVSASGSSVTSVEILTPYLSSSLPYELIKGSGSNGCNDNSSGSGGYSVSDDLLSMLENRKKQLTSCAIE